MHSKILSVAHYLPTTRITTEALLNEIQPERYSIPHDFIAERVGVYEVRHAKSKTMPSTLAIKAAKKALSNANINPAEIDVIIFTGIDRDFVEPSTAHVVQDALGATKATCFDVGNACLGFMTAMQIANYMVASGEVDHVLICTGEKPSMVTKEAIRQLSGRKCDINYRRKIGAFTVGDAGAAAIIAASDDSSGFRKFNFLSQGEFAKLCYLKYEGKGRIDGEMQMNPICTQILRAHKNLYNETLDKLEWTTENINCIITHQVGKRVFDGLAAIFGVEPKKMTKTFNFLGNITSATFAVNLSIALEEKRLMQGDKVLIALTGSGLTIGQAGMII